MSEKVTSSSEKTENLTEKIRLWQIILGALFGFMGAFTPNVVEYVDKTWLDPPAVELHCGGDITITNPTDRSDVYGDEVDVTGTVSPTGPCENLFLVLSTVRGHNHFITDSVTVNPDGTWDATADLYFVPFNTKARLQARLCGKADAYVPESCLSALPEIGSRSNVITITRKRDPHGIRWSRPSDVTTQPPKNNMRMIGPSTSRGIEITEFNKTLMSGKVRGLKDPQKYKIVIYGKDTTFGWVKMPFPGNKKGFGWAPVMKDGSWVIELRERFAQKQNFIRDYVVLLMDRNEKLLDRVDDINKLKYIFKKEVK